MTKADLVGRAAGAVGSTVTRMSWWTLSSIRGRERSPRVVKDALERGEGIEIRGFGTFKVRHRKARAVRNPRTGERVEVPARAVPVLQPSRLLRDRLGPLATPANSRHSMAIFPLLTHGGTRHNPMAGNADRAVLVRLT